MPSAMLQASTGFAENPQTTSISAAAGAGLGGMVVFHLNSKDCVAPPACEQVKECMAQAAKKAFMGSAIMGAAASGGGVANATTEPSASASPLDEWTLGPALIMWRAFGQEHRRKASFLSFLGLDGLRQP
mmetsp:Transcript_18623/g.34952  ORF Transcript_18623/g.34952 Transcript_18623/m.34952 type:complete len:130 (-) Transcript_18623:97-486(-)